ncbi:hypothetical protein LOAG_03397 [Loa loa]|uniref:Uncharacterized protein n=1 Tax=Loa loa TaxID=7209 RepID=A0A1S0U6G5_LOALO|nr:hypothetical protein LOAG_03397 [Loa loa]EFO25087.2 hypothetical protein LOAG_03397 [Loa loa]
MSDLSKLDNETDRLLQASRIRLIMREMSPCIAKRAIEYRNDPSNSKSLLDVLEPICRCFESIALEAVSLADNGNVYLLKDPIHGRSVYEVSGTHSQCTYTCLPLINYCQCSQFLQGVIKRQRSFTVSSMLNYL